MLTNQLLSKVSGSNCIQVVILKKCKPELLYILTELFNVFQILERFHLCSLYLGMLGRGLRLKITSLLVFLLWLEKPLKIADLLDLSDIWQNFQGS